MHCAIGDFHSSDFGVKLLWRICTKICFSSMLVSRLAARSAAALRLIHRPVQVQCRLASTLDRTLYYVHVIRMDSKSDA
jgi:hypothetical protein